MSATLSPNSRVFENWGGLLRFQPKNLAMPSNEDEVIQVVRIARQNKLNLRVIGTGHSWTHLIQTSDILMSLDNYQGLEDVDREKCTAWIRAGTKLFRLGEELLANGLAMINLGDINKQAIAGALGTGTHGTGLDFGIIATQALAVRMVTGTGELLELTAKDNPELFRAGLCTLGSLGVITKVKLQLVPAYKLELVKKREKIADILPNALEISRKHRNFELYAFPYSDKIQTKYSNIVEGPNVGTGFSRYIGDVVLENGAFKVISEIARMSPGSSRGLSRFTASAVSGSRLVDYGCRVYATVRAVRFQEMEYGVPAEDGPEALQRILAWIEKEKIRVHFPLEYRYVKGDDIFISPASGRDTCFISCHMYKGMPHEKYFAGVEKIMEDYDSRPHWGKMHTLKADQLSKKYPLWENFLAVREQVDPDGIFLNEHLRGVFGIPKRTQVPVS